jgi:molybdate transport system substrate-binding protein
MTGRITPNSFLLPAHFFPLLLLVFSLSSCQAANPTQEYPPLSQPALIVAAASDLQFAFTEIAAQFEAETGSAVTLVFGSTGQLTQQIENGAPYDVFAAAQIDYLDRLAAKSHIDSGTIELYGRGRLVLAANQGYSNPIENLADLLAPEIRHIAIANPSHAPYGLAAHQALQSVGLWEALQPKIVFGETVRQALQYVQTGDAEAGLVALSTADVPEIRWTLLDEQLHEPLEQAIAVVSASSQPELAARFISFVSGEQGRSIMRKYGFLLPGEDFYPNNPETLQ